MYHIAIKHLENNVMLKSYLTYYMKNNLHLKIKNVKSKINILKSNLGIYFYNYIMKIISEHKAKPLHQLFIAL